MTLQQLKYAITIADKRTISEAANTLFLSQPSLSNSIKALEAEINLNIFVRTNRGIDISKEGAEFLGYARQVVEQSELLEKKYLNTKPSKQKFSVSTQHYAFAVSAFVDLINYYSIDEYEFSLRETKTYEVIEDVKTLKSEVGILYINDFNEKVMRKILSESNVVFKELFIAKPHVFISKQNPMSKKKIITLKNLEEYPYLNYEQGEYNSFYFNEEILSTIEHKKTITVRDRATMFNLLIGVNGYTISTGIISSELNGVDIIAVPLDVDETIQIGTITHKNTKPSMLGEIYLKALNDINYNNILN